MSTKFQETLIRDLSKGEQPEYYTTDGSSHIPFGANITIKNKKSQVFLHSHAHLYPKEYSPGRVSSGGQQVNSKQEADANSLWKLEAADIKTPYFELTELEGNREVVYLRNGDSFLLKHQRTGAYLLPSNSSSYSTPLDVEITASKMMNHQAFEGVWTIFSTECPAGTILSSKEHSFQIVYFLNNISLTSHSKELPSWGFSQVGVSGSKMDISMKKTNQVWSIADVFHKRYLNGMLKLT
jgi:dolichyl-phosphate-mannose--protein O-mannosyl transferase